MNINKIGIMLCLAYQESEGPFYVKVNLSNFVEWKLLSKFEIDKLSDEFNIIEIDISLPRSERRWRDRGYIEDRRKKFE